MHIILFFIKFLLMIAISLLPVTGAKLPFSDIEYKISEITSG